MSGTAAVFANIPDDDEDEADRELAESGESTHASSPLAVD
jgi:hypothetical protein